MKKSFLALAATVLLVTDINAQDDKSVRLGLALCPNIGLLNSQDKTLKSDGSRIGFRFGLLGDFRLGSNANYFFSTGMFLNNLGAKTKLSLGDSLNTVFKSEVKFQYVELPITIKLKTNEIGYMTYFGQIGFDAGVRVAAKGKPEGGEFEDISDGTNILRLGLVVGGGMEYNFSGNTSALVGLKYSNAFTSINDNDGPKARLNYFELTLGALF
ncbi:MAG: PorT family protein [Flavobacteriales bacterium]|nr:PorT family protein [Flavobacteriales bacterium]